jgi:xanthine/CO dehydrogenase XdhC/CoxF family maturation factor
MIHWKETAEVLARLDALARAGRRAALATVVRIAGSAYRRPGAKLLVEEGGGALGSVSGGCLEADVREHALAAIRGAAPRLIHYDTGSDDRTVWGLGLGCNGEVDIFVQPFAAIGPQDPIRATVELLQGDAPFATSTVLDGKDAGRRLIVTADGARRGSLGDDALDPEAAAAARTPLGQGRSELHEVASRRVFTEVLLPPPHLVIFGAGDDSIALATVAAATGFRVAVVDHRPAFLADGRFPGARSFQLRPEQGLGALPLGRASYAVVKTHSFANDREWLRALLARDVPFIGVLGPRARLEEILRQLGAAGDDRVHGPVGLDVGADGPEQVAVSIVAEVLAVRAGREPVPLRRKEGPIHG